jgi:hypothetical protein
MAQIYARQSVNLVALAFCLDEICNLKTIYKNRKIARKVIPKPKVGTLPLQPLTRWLLRHSKNLDSPFTKQWIRQRHSENRCTPFGK